jgi:hypothetical protein
MSVDQLRQLVGNGGEVPVILSAPYGSTMSRAMRILDEHAERDLDESFYGFTGRVYTRQDVPEVLQDSFDYMNGLGIEQKKAIFYYTSGGPAYNLNHVLMHKKSRDGQALALIPSEVTKLNTLIGIFKNAPSTTRPFVVFRGFQGSVDGRMFSSTTLGHDLMGFLMSGAFPRFESPLGIFPDCCKHVIFVMPGTKVLYFPDRMHQITLHKEAEVLLPPHMGTFREILDRRLPSIQNNIVGGVSRGTHIVKYWIYEPFSQEVISQLRTEDMLNADYAERHAAPPRTLRASLPLFDQLALNAPHMGGLYLGNLVYITTPTKPSNIESFRDPLQMATVVANQSDKTHEDMFVPRLTSVHNDRFIRVLPTLISSVRGLHPPSRTSSNRSGLIVVEPDGRVWVTHPTDQNRIEFPCGPVQPGDDNDLRKTAVRTTYEQTGLVCQIVPSAKDIAYGILFESRTGLRYYLARRIGGNPGAMNYKTQAVSLCPVGLLSQTVTPEFPEILPLIESSIGQMSRFGRPTRVLSFREFALAYRRLKPHIHDRKIAAKYHAALQR